MTKLTDAELEYFKERISRATSQEDLLDLHAEMCDLLRQHGFTKEQIMKEIKKYYPEKPN